MCRWTIATKTAVAVIAETDVRISPIVRHPALILVMVNRRLTTIGIFRDRLEVDAELMLSPTVGDVSIHPTWIEMVDIIQLLETAGIGILTARIFE